MGRKTGAFDNLKPKRQYPADHKTYRCECSVCAPPDTREAEIKARIRAYGLRKKSK